MEVKDFVKTILKDITEGVEEAINDKYSFRLSSDIEKGIEFDLAVLSKEEGKGKVGIEVFGIGGKTEGTISNEVVNRIKFKVSPYKKG